MVWAWHGGPEWELLPFRALLRHRCWTGNLPFKGSLNGTLVLAPVQVSIVLTMSEPDSVRWRIWHVAISLHGPTSLILVLPPGCGCVSGQYPVATCNLSLAWTNILPSQAP